MKLIPGRQTKIVKIINDFLDNEIYCTDFNFNEHIAIKKDVDIAKNNIEKIVKNPDYILKDNKNNSIIYGKNIKGLWFNIIVREKSLAFKTFVVSNYTAKSDILSRYEILFRKV